ncbi:MAG: hypothetical protein PVI30_05570 [Myxococcales bacterium]|jgi:hypothetical protein
MRPRPDHSSAPAIILLASIATAVGCDAPVDVVATAVPSADAAAPDAGGNDALRCEDGQAWAAPARAALARHALCTCGDLSSASTLRIRSESGDDASLGVNGSGTQAVDARVDGDVIVAGAEGLRPGTRLQTGGALSVGGPLVGADADVAVSGDADVAGRIQVRSLSVGGSLRVPAGADVEVAEGSAPAPSEVNAVDVTAPCACDPDDGADFDAVAGAITAAVEDPEAAGCAGAVIEADGAAELSLRPRGPTRLWVPGDLAIDGALRIEPPAGAVVELWIAGNVRVGEEVVLGGEGGGRVEVFVGGAGTIDLPRGGTLRGSLHAPEAELVLPEPLQVDGTLLVRRLAAEAPLTIRK